MIRTTRLIDKAPSAYAYPLLIKHLLHTPRFYMPDREIVYRNLVRYTYRQFFGRISRLATGLLARGIGPGDVVAVLDWDSHRYLEAYFAVPMIGAILHTVNVRLSPEQILVTMNHAQDALVLAHQDFLPLLAGIRDRLETVRGFILLKDGEGEIESQIPFEADYEELLAGGREEHDFPDFDENSMATLFYTTGTTGRPKGVCFSHRQLVLHTLGLAAAFGAYVGQGRFRSDDVYMPLTPMFHVHAWGMPYQATLLGVKQVYPGRYEPETILKLIDREGVTLSHCVAAILRLILSNPLAREVDLSRWKVVVGGGAFPQGLAQEALGLGIDAYGAYGMSETCPFLTLSSLKPDRLAQSWQDQIDVRVKTGLPLPLVEMKLVDLEGRTLPWDGQSTGEILIRAPWLTQSYYRAPDLGEALWQGGYMHTGDVAFADEEGYFKITDRLKDAIKSGGEWISSLELESLISQHPAVRDVAVVGLADEKWGERPVALVVAQPEAEGVSGEEVRQFLQGFVQRGVITRYAVPDRVLVVEDIPKTSVGKINKKLIREQLTGRP